MLHSLSFLLVNFTISLKRNPLIIESTQFVHIMFFSLIGVRVDGKLLHFLVLFII